MTRKAIAFEGTVMRDADGWIVTVPVRREHVTPEVRLVVRERLRIRREVARGIAWLPYSVADSESGSGSDGDRSRAPRVEQDR